MLKKTLISATCGLVIALALPLNAFAATVGFINDNGVNVRTAPSTAADAVMKVSKGEKLDIIERDNGWYKLNYNGGVAYIASDYVTIAQTIGLVNDNGVNLRAAASTEARIVAKVDYGTVLEITGVSGDFYVSSYNGETVYIHNSFVDGAMLSYIGKVSAPTNAVGQETLYALITSDNGLNLRAEPSTEAEILVSVPSQYAVDVLETMGDWLKISYSGKVGYISAEFAEVKFGVKPENAAMKAAKIIEYAKQFMGTPYVYGGTSLTKGVDCSGFTYSVFKNFGIGLNRSSRDQISNGTRVSKSELQPGDLVFFNTGGNSVISHVGLYIGGGNFIHAASGSAYRVIISSLSEDYYIRTFVAGARVL